MLRACLLGTVLVTAGCDAFAPERVHHKVGLTIAPPQGGQGTISEVTRPDQIPLRGYRVEAKKGDFVLKNGRMVAVVSRVDGEVIDFGPEGALDGLVAITPAVYDPIGQPRSPVVFIGVEPEAPNVLHVIRRSAALPIRLHTFVTFRGDVLVIESTVEPESIADSGMAIGLGERVWWGNIPTWVQGYGFGRRESVTQTAAFMGRESRELSYAIGASGEVSMVRLGSAGLAGFSAIGRASEFTVALSGDRSPRRTLLLAASETSVGQAASQLFSASSMRTIASPGITIPESRVEVAECPADDVERKPYARFRANEPVIIPNQGCFEARLWAPGYQTTEWAPIDELAKQTLPPSGTLVITALTDNKPGIARIQVRGLGSTSNPDWGEDAQDGTALNVAHVHKGLLSRAVPPGRYQVVVDRGFEYSAAETVVEVKPNERTYVALGIDRKVDTSGWISADLHLHADPSPDAPQSLDDRVLALAAASVEVGVATDHNRVSDYGPSIQRLGLAMSLASIVGDEVTTEEMAFGHFNVFPLESGSEPLTYRRTSPTAILAEARRRKPFGADTLIQMNHPRMGDIGYLDVVRFDPDDIASFLKRTPWAPLDFDAVELFNGDDAISPATVRGVMKDWYALLDAGHRITATGNSDAHRLTFHEPGLPRNYVKIPSDDPAKLDQRAFVEAIRKGRVVVSSGPFIRFHVDDADIGDTVAPGSRRAHITVDAPSWMSISYVELMKNGQVVARLEGPFTGDHAAELTETLTLAKGDWVIALAGGTKDMDVLYRSGVPPFAFTNPIFVGP